MEMILVHRGTESEVKMANRVFFSFHYERDNWRAGIVRNSNVTKEDSVFIDSAEWEEVKKKTKMDIEKWILDQMKGTSTTLVLIGKETSQREWVRFEIIESRKKGNAVIGITIHNIKDKDGNKDTKGNLDFGIIDIDNNGNELSFTNLYPVYDWVNDNGYDNLETWINNYEEACRRKNKYTVEISPRHSQQKWGEDE